MRLAVVLMLAGCGRVGFAPITDGNSSILDDGAAIGDGVKSPDADLSATCGDLTCNANVGETCKSCATDCKTTTAVCGNLACDPGEDGTTCEVDCGPSPWTWTQDETDIVNAINSARMTGFSCNGTTISGAVLNVDATMTAAARDLAWESAQYNTVTIRRCDGESLATWASNIPANTYRMSSGVATGQARVNAWEADNNACGSMINGTKVGVGVATGAANTVYVVVLR